MPLMAIELRMFNDRENNHHSYAHYISDMQVS